MSILLTSTNEEYHSNRSHLSSSNLKMLLNEPNRFYEEWVLNKRQPQVEKAAFIEGSLVHTLILEPHLMSQYAVYSGLKKAGKAYEEFKAANPGKVILSIPQVERCEQLVRAYEMTKVATEMISGGFAEYTLLASILGVPVKARADYINTIAGYIVDVKTTSEASEKELFTHSISQWGYDLSAALYCQIAYENYGRLFDFYWIVLSKADGLCRVYKASTNTLSNGAAQVTKALVKYKKGMETGLWFERDKLTFSEEIQEI